MQLKSLSMKGFGPYTLAQTVRFPDRRKIVITGNNGHGKTFLLDTLPAALFKSVPNRQGGFYAQFSGNDAFIDLEFAHGGHNYRIKRLVNANSRTQKAFLFRDGEPLTEGKESQFDAAIAALGFDERSFMAACYQAQNGAGNALSLPMDERSKLLAAILNLTAFDGDYATVCEAHKVQRRAVDALQTQRDTLAAGLPDTEALAAEADALVTDGQILTSEIARLNREEREAVEAAATAKANAFELTEIQRQRYNLITEIDADQTALKDRQTRLDNTRTLLLAREAEILAAVTEAEGIAARVQAREVEIAQINERAQAWREEGQKEIREVSAQLAALREVEKARDQEARAAQQKRAAAEQTANNLKAEIARIVESTAILGRVPCKGLDIEATCELLRTARTDAAKVPGLEAALESEMQASARAHEEDIDIQHLLYTLTGAIEQAQAALDNLTRQTLPSDITDSLSAAQDALKADKARLAELAPLVAMAPKLEGAQERAQAYEAEIAQLTERIARNTGAAVEMDSRIQAAAALDQTVRATEARIADLTASRQHAEQAAQQGLARLAVIEAERSRAQKIADQIEEMDSLLNAASARLSELDLLREGLGPRGAKNLKIDAAGRAISARANRLLRIGMGPQFSLAITTLEELREKDEDGNPKVRETLQFRVLDNETGDEKVMENLSGGEKAIVSLVFSLALAIEQRDSAGVDIQTLILDEPSAALSEENSAKYVEMLDAVLAETGIQQVIFISHSPVMQALADAVIHVQRTDAGSLIEIGE